MVQEYELPVNLLSLEMYDSDVIQRMKWLSQYNAIIDRFSKTMIFKKSRDLEFSFQREKKVLSSCIILAMTAKRYLQKGYSAYLAYLSNKDIQEAKLKTILVVKEFPEELIVLSPVKELEFTIDLTPGNTPIPQAPYRMALSELKELWCKCIF